MTTRPLNTYDRISIAQVVLYSFFLLGGIFLCFKHGASRSAGWYFLIILALARLVGASMYLATIHDPSNTSLYIGWLTCTGIALTPLILMLHSLLFRVFTSVNHRRQTLIKPVHQRLVNLLMLPGFILVIVGNTKSDYSLQGNGRYHVEYATESKVGMAIIVIVFAILVVESLLALRYQNYAAQGEYRVVIACLLSLPFVLVRVVYSSWTIFGDNSAGVWFYLGGSVIMEIVAMFIVEAVGFAVGKVEPQPEPEPELESK